MKIAIAHDWMFSMRGGEKVLECLFELFPTSDLYVLVFDRKRVSNIIKKEKSLHLLFNIYLWQINYINFIFLLFLLQ